jgi:hypothetical protein
MNDGFLEALHYAIKEEVVDNYFHSRRVVEEEIAEVQRAEKALHDLARRVKGRLADLAGLFLEWSLWGQFWRRLGIEEQDFGPEPRGLIWTKAAGGLGWRGRYKRLVRATAGLLGDEGLQVTRAFEDFAALTAAVNADIERFHANHDFLMLRSVLSQMDPEVLGKRFYLGGCLDGQACLNLDMAMRFRRLEEPDPEDLPLPGWPGRETVVQAALATAGEALQTQGPLIQARLSQRG